MAMSCLWCGAEFPTSTRKTKRFCNGHRCVRAWHQAQRIERQCAGCDQSFRPYKPNSRYCSSSCWLKTYNTEEPEHGQRGAEAAGQYWTSQRGTGNGYVKFYGRHEHRVVAEKKIGRLLASDEIVHHVDGDKQNNSPENLEVMSQNEHARLHMLERYHG